MAWIGKCSNQHLYQTNFWIVLLKQFEVTGKKTLVLPFTFEKVELIFLMPLRMVNILGIYVTRVHYLYVIMSHHILEINQLTFMTELLRSVVLVTMLSPDCKVCCLLVQILWNVASFPSSI